MDLYSIRIRAFHEFYLTLWDMISRNRHILVNIRKQKLDLWEVYTQKVQEKFIKRSYSDTIGGPFCKAHPVIGKAKYDLLNQSINQALGNFNYFLFSKAKRYSTHLKKVRNLKIRIFFKVKVALLSWKFKFHKCVWRLEKLETSIFFTMTCNLFCVTLHKIRRRKAAQR